MWILRLAIALAALALLPTAPALADPPWSAPATITAGIPAVSEPTIGFGASGLAVLSARLSTEANGVPSRGFTRLFGQQPDGRFAGRARLVLAAPPAPYGTNRLALLRVPLPAGEPHDQRLRSPRVEPGLQLRAQRRADRGVRRGLPAVHEARRHVQRRDRRQCGRRRARRMGRASARSRSPRGGGAPRGRSLRPPAVDRRQRVFQRGLGGRQPAGRPARRLPALSARPARPDRPPRRGARAARRTQLGRGAAARRVERLQRDRHRCRPGRPDGRRLGHAGRRRGGRHAVDRARRDPRGRPARVSQRQTARAQPGHRAARRRGRGRDGARRHGDRRLVGDRGCELPPRLSGASRDGDARRGALRHLRRRCRPARPSATWRSTNAAPRSSSRRRCRCRATTRRPSRSSPACGPPAQPPSEPPS